MLIFNNDDLAIGAVMLDEVLRLDRRSGRSGDMGVHQKPGAGGQPLGANEFVALIGHLQVANKCRIASAILTAASSGPIPKAPGSAGEYLLQTYVDALQRCQRWLRTH